MKPGPHDASIKQIKTAIKSMEKVQKHEMSQADKEDDMPEKADRKAQDAGKMSEDMKKKKKAMAKMERMHNFVKD